MTSGDRVINVEVPIQGSEESSNGKDFTLSISLLKHQIEKALTKPTESRI
jgi:hypothetical protein